jgi:hypothetical protein
MVDYMLTGSTICQNVFAEVAGALQFVPCDFATLVAFNAGKWGEQDPELHRFTWGEFTLCLGGKLSIEITLITTGFLGAFRARKMPSHTREASIEKDEPKYTKLKDPPAALSPKTK